MRRLRPSLAGLLILLVPAAAFAGEIDAHLAATYYLARKAGFAPADARQIAIADWSMDLNSTTTAFDGRAALPDVDAPPVYRMRGRTFHSLCGSPEAVVQQLGVLRDGVDAREGGERLIAMGQYLHALQDSFFHQTPDGKPFDPELGHALVPGTDTIASHYDAALHANEFTLAALEAFHEHGTPAVPSASEIYFRDLSGMHFSPEHFRKLQREDSTNDLVAMTRAIADSYEIRHRVIRGKMHGEWQETEVTEIGDLDFPAMNRKLSDLWADRKNAGSLAPPGEIGWDSPEKISYDANPGLLIMEAPVDPIVSSARVAAAAAVGDVLPGGISFTRAAALSLPIDLDLDSVHVEKGVVMLSGRRGEASGFDAALFLTAVRLACTRDDPAFSLDPVDGGAFMNASPEIIRAVGERFVPRLLESEEFAAAEPSEGDETGVTGPDLRTFDLREKDPALAKELIDDRAEMRAKLVFHPEWLRKTRLGETMYRGDLLLKELTLGIAVLDRDGAAPVRDVHGYHSAIEMMATDGLRALLEGTPADEVPAAVRLWFEIAHPVAPRIPSAGGSLDLTAVRPQIFVRRHDAATGLDEPGSERHFDGLATLVNGDLPAYEEKYPDVGRLEAALRAYVAALRIAQADPEVCDGLEDMPLLPSEKVETDLPETIAPVLAVSIAISRTASSTEAGEAHVAAGMLNGGVSLGARRSLAHAYDPSGSELTSIVTRAAGDWKTRPAAWSDEDRGFLVLRDDLGAIGSQRRKIARYEVRAETVEAIVRGDRAGTGPAKLRRGFFERSVESPLSAIAFAFLWVATIWGLGLVVFLKAGRTAR